MKKNIRTLAAAGCCAALLAAGGATAAFGSVITAGQSQEQMQEPEVQAPDLIGVWGTITSISDGRIMINNISPNSSSGDMVLQISQEYGSRVVDAVEGLPVSLDELQVGDFVYAYIGPAMTMSLPPITNAEMVICKAPADFRVPEYTRITNRTVNEDGSVILTGSNGNTYRVTAETTLLPYLTRQMITIDSIQEGDTCMIWSDADTNAGKLVLFPGQAE